MNEEDVSPVPELPSVRMTVSGPMSLPKLPSPSPTPVKSFLELLREDQKNRGAVRRSFPVRGSSWKAFFISMFLLGAGVTLAVFNILGAW